MAPDIDPDAIAATHERARNKATSLGGGVYDLAGRGVAPARVECRIGRPVIRAPADAPPITPEIVRRALDEE